MSPRDLNNGDHARKKNRKYAHGKTVPREGKFNKRRTPSQVKPSMPQSITSAVKNVWRLQKVSKKVEPCRVKIKKRRVSSSRRTEYRRKEL